MGAIGMAARENLDNLIFVVNCNLQRLDGPVRGNGKIIQELESDFRGAGWNVIKVIWGTHWDPLFARDKKGILMRRMMECVDGEYQTFKTQGRRLRARALLQHAGAEGAGRRLVRRRHLEPEPRRPRPAQDLRGLPRGGATTRASRRSSSPRRSRATAWATSGEAQNITHQQKKMSLESIRALPRPLRDPGARRQARGSAVRQRSPEGSPELEYMRARRMELGGYLPARRRKAAPLVVPELVRVRAVPEEHRGPRDLDDDGVRADPADCCCATRTSASTSCRSCPTSRAPSAWRACSASSASGTSRASSTRRRTPTS